MDTSVPGSYHVNKNYPIAGDYANPTKQQDFSIDQTVNMVDPNNPIVNTYHPPKMGDIIAFGLPTSEPGEDHVGIYLGDGIYISATTNINYQQKDVVIKRVSKEYKRITYRSPGE